MNFLNDKNEVNKTGGALLIGIGATIVAPWVGVVIGVATIAAVVYANFFANR